MEELKEQYYKLSHWIDRMRCTAYERAEMKAVANTLVNKCQSLTNEVEELKKANKRLEEKVDAPS